VIIVINDHRFQGRQLHREQRKTTTMLATAEHASLSVHQPGHDRLPSVLSAAWRAVAV
jgi:hypothetical protein